MRRQLFVLLPFCTDGTTWGWFQSNLRGWMTQNPSTFLPLIPRGEVDEDGIKDISSALKQLHAILLKEKLDRFESHWTASWLTKVLSVCQVEAVLEQAGSLLNLLSGVSST